MLAVQHQYPKCITKIDSLVHAVKLGIFLQYWLNKNGEGAGDMTPVNGGKENPCILLPAALRKAQICRYLVYSEADFEVFRPGGTTLCTDGGEIWHGGGDLGQI